MLQGKPDLHGRHTEPPVDSDKFCRKTWLKLGFNPDPNSFMLSSVPLEHPVKQQIKQRAWECKDGPDGLIQTWGIAALGLSICRWIPWV